MTDEFMTHVDLSHVALFNSAAIFSRPCSTVSFTLDFGVFSEWLHIVVPDGTEPGGVVPTTDALLPNFANLEMDIKQVHVSYNQFSLNQKLLN